MKQITILSFLIGILSACGTKQLSKEIDLGFDSQTFHSFELQNIQKVSSTDMKDWEGQYNIFIPKNNDFYVEYENDRYKFKPQDFPLEVDTTKMLKESRLDMLQILVSNDKLYARLLILYEGENTANFQRIPVKLLKNNTLQVNGIIYSLYKVQKSIPFIAEKNELGIGTIYEVTYSDTKKILQFSKQKSDFELFIREGKFPESSFVKLEKEDITDFSDVDLELMKAEIMVRKGATVPKGNAFYEYFQNQDWYKQTLKFQEGSIKYSEVEQHNINIIDELLQ